MLSTWTDADHATCDTVNAVAECDSVVVYYAVLQ